MQRDTLDLVPDSSVRARLIWLWTKLCHRQCASVCRSLAFIVAFYSAAALVFGFADEPGLRSRPDRAVTPLDSVYFATMLMSTVGYGDLYPTTAGGRVATVMFAVVGIFVIFVEVGNISRLVFQPFTEWMRAKLHEWNPPTVVAIPGLTGSVELVLPVRAITYYMRNMLPSLMLLSVLQFTFAGFLCAAQPSLDYGSAWYNMIITMTTVGLGDVAITTDRGRLVVTAHILLTVGILTTTFNEFISLRKGRKIQLKQLMLMLRRSDPKLIQQLQDLNEQALLQKRLTTSQRKHEPRKLGLCSMLPSKRTRRSGLRHPSFAALALSRDTYAGGTGEAHGDVDRLEAPSSAASAASAVSAAPHETLVEPALLQSANGSAASPNERRCKPSSAPEAPQGMDKVRVLSIAAARPHARACAHTVNESTQAHMHSSFAFMLKRCTPPRNTRLHTRRLPASDGAFCPLHASDGPPLGIPMRPCSGRRRSSRLACWCYSACSSTATRCR